MCGIAGLLISHTKMDIGAAIKPMVESLQRRGPDASGVWVSSDQRVALGHRRLSVLDLSCDGNQPMQSACGRYVMTYNGEVYNYLDLREELKEKNYIFRGDSDTEVILSAISEWGLEETLHRLNGMFALALWDNDKNQLTLVRDRIGIKPLFFGMYKGTFLFGSTLNALEAFRGFRGEIDPLALTLFLQRGYVPAPRSILADVYKLLPGTYLTISLEHGGVLPKPQRFWSSQDFVVEQRSELDERDAIDQMETLLKDAVKRQMISDVPIGAFLSGGIDSSLVTALMQTQSSRPVKTFSIGFGSKAFDESFHARAVARHLGTDHTECHLTDEDARSAILELNDIYDEPFGDSSQIPTYLVSKLARQSVTVCLSGDGGDEVFGGYNRYIWAPRIWNKVRKVPMPLRQMCAPWLRRASALNFNFLSGSLRQPADKLSKLAKLMTATSEEDIYERLISQEKFFESKPLDLDRPRILPNFAEHMMHQDLTTYLPDDVLTKVDRASMRCSLEVRVPLLDHRIVEFAWSLPLTLKIRDGQSKWLLRQVLLRHIPPQLISRPKMGFAVPLGDWLRGPLRDWANNQLNSSDLAQESFLDAKSITQAWQNHLEKKENNEHQLWNVLMFQSWFNKRKNTTLRKSHEP